ncbi:hypothetical protein EDEG_01003 [Edhazardia aedis USNM 41457]|uniref:Uncharacterized protein n=1 Tax=Edhazardia aedis (strain USNM 41457) TaxID=1003232 RepID=J9DAK1_EDHAE|nr:hypothetical protein EDEG_01003 [Edhazardia aedis USNM 41457]|eukprot:EJW04781.1 hypothetical protein EDEG_01003 [Edhazardia aedis USNM 41457]
MNNSNPLIARILSQEAFKRYQTLAQYRPKKVAKVDALLLNAYSRGLIANELSDQDFVRLLENIEEEKQNLEVKTIRRRKDDLDLEE